MTCKLIFKVSKDTAYSSIREIKNILNSEKEFQFDKKAHFLIVKIIKKSKP
jgi:hypothetical protein